MKLTIISAVGIDGVIGEDDKIPWYIPEDFKHFRNTTMHGVLLVGYNTYLTLPDKAFEGREYVVICNDDKKIVRPNVYQFNNIEKAFDFLKSVKVFVIGGAMIYNDLIEYCDEAIITWVNKKTPFGNKRFPLVKLFTYFDVVENQEWQKSISGLEYKVTKFIRNPNKGK